MDTCTVSLGGKQRRLLLICNTPGDHLEIRDAVAPYGLITSIPTGMRPVTVRWNPDWKRAFVCNFLGDSVTSIDIRGEAGAGGSVGVRAELLSTTRVGDEPTDIVFPVPRVALVSLKARAAIVTCAAASMQPLVDDQRIEFPLPLELGGDSAHDVVAKHPWMLEMRGDRLFLLDHMDDDRAELVSSVDKSVTAPRIMVSGLDLVIADLDLTQAFTDWVEAPAAAHRVQGIGTTPHAMALSASGNLLFVVASQARHLDVAGEHALSLDPTGFVRSWLRVVHVTNPAGPIVRGEHTVGSPRAPSINLNRDYTVAGIGEVPAGATIAQPTGIALIEDGSPVPTVVVTGFSSDRVAFMRFSSQSPSGWDITYADLQARIGYEIAGPRAAHFDAVTGQVFVSRSLDHAFSVFDANAPTNTPATVGLEFDPRPAAILEGHRFLYSAEFSRAQTVSCSSCHIDGTTDGLAWDLGDDSDELVPNELKDRVQSVATFAPQKGTIVTQTLQGLLNFPVSGDAAADLFSNRPYHWRADRASFEAFRGAFTNLLGGVVDVVSPTEMSKFRRLVDTIVHAPNPNQPLTREVQGDFGVLADVNDGDGSARGMKVFLTQPTLLNEASCVHCHSFPDGSNNRLTEVFSSTSSGNTNPLESAAIRNVFGRESVLFASVDVPAANEELTWFRLTGMTHDNQVSPAQEVGNESIPHFLARFFNPGHPVNLSGQPDTRRDLNQFVREWDTGVAPIVGRAYTLSGNSTANATEHALLTSQVQEANAGLVAYVSQGGMISRYWLDLTLPAPARYRLANSATAIDFATLQTIAAGSGNQVVLQSVPVGSAQAVATRGNPMTTTLPATNVTLLKMAPPTHLVGVAQFDINWAAPLLPNGPGPLPSVVALKTLQANAIPFANGMNAQKLEPTRRFRVAGDDIFPGAELVISGPGLAADLVLPIYPTDLRAPDNRQIWETAVEADDVLTLALLNSGPEHPWTRWVLDLMPTQVQPLPPTSAAAYDVTVRNPGAPVAAATSQVLQVQDTR